VIFRLPSKRELPFYGSGQRSWGRVIKFNTGEFEMIFVGNLLHTIIQIFILLVIVQALLSFVMDPYHPIRQKINQIVDPFLQPIRRVVPPIANLDFSPLILIIILQLVDRYFVSFFF